LAEFELQMKYTTRPIQVGMRLIALLFPIWGILLPILLVTFIVLILRLPANIPLASSLLIIASMLSGIALCSFLAVYLEDDLIRVSKEGLAFPLRLLPDLKYRREFAWKDLTAIRLQWQRGASFSPEDTLTLFFAGSGYAKLFLNRLKLEQLEQFFIAFEACAFKCERDAELSDFEQAVQTKKLGSAYSHTELWQKSLADRFTGATFVPLEPGTNLQSGRLQIMRQLAFGGFSAIYLARSVEGKFVVLKESNFPASNDETAKASQLFEREASILSKIDHPNISRVIDYFVENSRHYLVMAHIEGIDLNRLTTLSGQHSEPSILNWASQLAEAISYLHSQTPPVVHRDIAPDNLILKPDGTLMLIDFGAAKEIVQECTGTVVGKQSFMAPEQFQGKPCLRSDVYSFGATLYFLLTGKNPEPLTQSFSQSVAQTSDVEKQDLKSVKNLIFRATAFDANERPDFSDIIESLESLKSAQNEPEQQVVEIAKI
jgi:hypothetical protein